MATGSGVKMADGQHGNAEQAGKRMKVIASETSHRTATPVPTTRLDEMSESLRRAYRETLDESVPDSLMDLLNKLA